MRNLQDAKTQDYLQFFITYTKTELRGNVYISDPHVHHTGELMLVRSGESIIQCGDSIGHVTAPYIVYYPPRVPHTQNNNALIHYERWCFPIFPASIGQSFSLPDRHFIVQLTDEQCEFFSSCARLLTKYYSTPNNCWLHHIIPRSMQEELRLKYLLLLFMNELEPLIPEKESGTRRNLINNVCMYINEHPAEDLSLNALSKKFFVAKSSLTHEFRRRMDMSIGEFITTSRVMHVKNHLRKEIPLSEIAENSGFSSASYMIKVFTKHTGITPAQYRAKLIELSLNV